MKKKQYLLNSNSGDFLKAGGAFFYDKEDGASITVCCEPRELQFAIYSGTEILFKTENLLTIIKKIRDYYCFELGYKFKSKYTTVPRGYDVYC